MRDPLGCDVMTGRCVRCTGNTSGAQCEQCHDWFYGDAVKRKDCKRMICSLEIIVIACINLGKILVRLKYF